MNIKKIILIISLIVVVVAAVVIIIMSNNKSKNGNNNVISNSVDINTSNATNSLRPDAQKTTQSSSETKKTTLITEVEEGTEYSIINGAKVTPNIVIGDNYFDTQLSDILLNFNEYAGKVIEIEGFNLKNDIYNFIGRYSTSNLCQYCPNGYSYFEYEWRGDKIFDFTDEKEWLKIIGTLKKANDGVEYYYIDVLTLTVMNKRGIDSVSN